MKIILASKSPRRVEILHNIGAEFEIIPANTDESVEDGMSVSDAVMEISKRKALCVLEKHNDAFIISADTVVTFDCKIIGKPKDEDHAFRILKSLSGRSHAVLTGFTLCTKDKVYCSYISTEVDFRELSDDEVYRYIKSGEPMDKAGAYGIQEKGSVFVTGIRGDYFNVMGLPICEITQIADKQFNIQLTKF
jgi:septum formation protein